jgi:hypothetical protein
MARPVSLTTITVSFVLVAVLFNLAGLLSTRWIGPASGIRGPEGSAGPADWGALVRAVWPAATVEALALTLLAVLWFGTVGNGGWLLLFLLLGTLVAGGDRWLRHRLLTSPAGNEVRLFAAGVLKYLLAGLLCAWRLS